MPKSGHAASRLASLDESVTETGALAPSAIDTGAIDSGSWFRDPAVVYRQELEIDQRVAEQAARRAVAVLAAPVWRQAGQRPASPREAVTRMSPTAAAVPPEGAGRPGRSS